jgi:hypothetical protein
VEFAKIFLLLFTFLALWFATHHRGRTQAKAFRRIAFVGLVAGVIVAVLLPDFVTDIANRLGIGRGADLIFYISTVGLLYVSISVYLKFGDMDRRITKLARQVALYEDAGKIQHPGRSKEDS